MLPSVPFIVVVPGLPIIHYPPVSDHDRQYVRQASETEYEVIIPNANTTPEFYIALEGALPSAETGLGVYHLTSEGNYEFLNVVSNSYPSQCIATGWSAKPEMQQQCTARIGLVLESSEVLLAKLGAIGQDYRLMIAEKTASNLVNFLQSFSGYSGEIDRAVEVWLKRFLEKAKLDPYFIMRSD